MRGQQLSVGLVAASVACLCLSGFLVFALIPETKREAARTRELQAEMSRVEILVAGQANDERGYLLTGDPMFLEEFRYKQAEIDALLLLLAADAPAPAKAEIDEAVPHYRSFLGAHLKVVALFEAGDNGAANALALGQARSDRKGAQGAFAKAADDIVSQSAAEWAREAMFIRVAGGALMVLGLGLLIVAAEVSRRVRNQHRAAAALRDSEQHFRSLIDYVPAAVYVVDLDGLVSGWNPAASAMFGWSELETIGHVLPFAPTEFSEQRTVGDPKTGLEMTRRCRDGSTIDVSVSTAPMLDGAGQVVATIVTENLRRSDRHLAAIVASSADAILSTSLDGTVTSWNAGAEAMYGYTAAEIIGQPLITMTRPDDRDNQRAIFQRVMAGHSVVGAEVVRVRKNGTEFPVAITASPLLDGDDRVIGMSGITRDVTAQKALEATLEQRALHDELTGLPNRALFVDRVTLAMTHLPRHTGVVAVLFIDIDQFKVINDSLGHDQGDRLLVMVAEALTIAVRPGDTVARFGGDEFAVLCEDLRDDAEAVAIGERIQNALTTPFVLDGRDHYVTVSAGIATADSPCASAADLLRDADSSMYQAKDAGRSCSVLFAHAMRTRALHRLDTELSLRRAINEGELLLHYQPIVNLSSGRIDGVEALVRWKHPTKGTMPPSEFIPVAEETGLIVPLGEWVLGAACRQMQTWHSTHPELAHLTVAVNLSGRQITQVDLVDVVANILASSGLEPGGLVLEITESVLMRDAAYTIAVLRALKALGLGLSVDDFGTGYSSLAYLKKFPVDILKIDKSFVDGLGTDDDDSAIVDATITLARSLGLTTVAEGVETAIQEQTLTRLGCNRAQGFLFCRPQPAEAITQHLLLRATATAL